MASTVLPAGSSFRSWPRLQGLTRVVASFLCVFAAYQLYALIAVPLIEPRIEKRPETSGSGGLAAGGGYERQRRELMAWFKPGDWELASPTIIETPQGILLIKEYANLPDGRVRLQPCSMIFVPEGPPQTLAERQRKAIVLRCPGGAELEFDSPMDLKRAEIGRLVGGNLRGEIEITSDQKQPGPEDDLIVHTRDVVLAEQTIRSSAEVQFALGSSRGHGRRLTIVLASKGAMAGNHGVRSFELAENVELHVEANQADVFPGATVASTPKNDPPIDIRCAGPFQFDFVRQTATFDKQVNLLRANAAGPSDTMACDRLALHFQSLNAAEPKSTGGMPKMKPVRVEAWGNPLVIEAPSRQMTARAQLLAYDIETRGATLHDEYEVSLNQGNRELHAREVFFQPDATGTLGTFLATGRGWLRGTLPDDESKSFTAQWSSRLHFRPHEGNHVLSIEGAAHVEMPERGSLDADELHLWLLEAPAQIAAVEGGIAAGKTRLIAERLMAKGNVNIDAPQLVGTIAQLQCWFDYEAGPDLQNPANVGVPGATVGPRLAPADAPTIGTLERPQPPLRSQVIEMIPAGRAEPEQIATPTPYRAPPEEPPQAPSSRYRLAGGLVRMRAGVRGKQTQLSELMIEQDVHVEQLPLEGSDEQSLDVTGQFVHVVQPRPEQARVKVMGQPARIQSKGMTIASDAIHFDQAEGTAHTDGAGMMSLPAKTDLDGRALGDAQMLEIVWQGTMNFDGLTARFEREVVARLGPQLAKTESLTATFTRRIALQRGGRDPLADKPEIAQVALSDGAYIEQRTFDGDRLVAFDRLYADDLELFPASGEMTASGPGKVISLRIDDGSHGVPGVDQPAVPSRPGGEQLTFLQVEFQRRLSGNRQSRALKFEHQVHALYGPVQHWEDTIDPDRPETWGENGVLMSSDTMIVSEVGGAPGSPRSYEMEALGNTVVEGNTFTARAGRLTYAQAKDQLVLEGTTSDARLFKQDQPGAPMKELAARKIMYWPRTRRADVQDFKFLDLTTPPGKP